jgi:2-polyprenyl-3-methyl-5-hydroxy-6-metoxy-1,4-benzoquinol methylase
MEHNKDDWDKHWTEISDVATLNPAQQMRHEFILSLLSEAKGDLKSRDGMNLLDIGSGQGDMAQLVHDKLPDAGLVGFELSTSGVEISRGKVPNARFFVADLYKVNSELDAFQNWATHAICSEVLEHVDTPVDFLINAKRYLSTNAQLVVTVPGGPKSKFDQHIGHRRHFTKKSLTALLENAGFRVECVYRTGFPFFNLYRLTVIARGARLIEDARSVSQGKPSRLATAVMKIYRGLFFLNLRNFPFGWQMVAVARKLE